MKKNIFVFGLNDANRAQMAHIPNADDYVFHSLLAPEEVVEAETYDFGQLLDKARRQLNAFEGSIDGITTFWDFPSTELLALLCEELDLPGPSAQTVVRCAHKYISRAEQQKVIPDNIPSFQAVNPFDDAPLSKIKLNYPFFLKPVKSYASVLQIAAQRPPELKAVITICSTDDRYNADAHYIGGAMLADNLSWASIMFAQNTQPPDPEIVGEQWFELWLKRLKGNGLWLEKWMRHPWRDDYWKHGSVGEDYSTIQCPVLAVGGWADGYSNAIFRLLENLKIPRKGIIGPWSHTYPHFGKPGPAIGFLQESLRWWNYWLKGIDTGVATDPDLVVYMQDYSRPGASVTHRAGSWLALPSWPCEKIKQLSFFLDEEGGLNPNAGSQPEKRTYKVQSPLSVGLLGGKWCSYSTTPDLPHDQHEDDGGSLIFESKPLRSNLSILGTPAIQLEIASNKPVAMIAVRLSDVSPDDKATRISYGLLNLTHRNSHETPEPLKPGNRYHVRIELNEIAQTVPRGHRIRIAISSSYFPVAWPSPEPVRLSIFSGESQLIIPYIPRDAEKSMTTAFREPLVGPCSLTRQIKKPERGWFIKRDMMNETTTVEVLNDEGKIHYEDTGLDIATRTTEKYSYQYNDYNSLRGETHCDIIFEREGWKVETMTRTILTSGKHRFKVRATLDAYLNGSRVFSNSWDESIPRKLL